MKNGFKSLINDNLSYVNKYFFATKPVSPLNRDFHVLSIFENFLYNQLNIFLSLFNNIVIFPNL